MIFWDFSYQVWKMPIIMCQILGRLYRNYCQKTVQKGCMYATKVVKGLHVCNKKQPAVAFLGVLFATVGCIFGKSVARMQLGVARMQRGCMYATKCRFSQPWVDSANPVFMRVCTSFTVLTLYKKIIFKKLEKY